MLTVESRNVEWFGESEAYPETSKQYKDGWTDIEVVGLGGLVCGWWWSTLVSRESCHGVVVTEVVGRGGTELRFKTWWSAWTPTFPPLPSPSICSPSSHGLPSRRNRERGVDERTSFHLQCFWTYYVLTQTFWSVRLHNMLMLKYKYLCTIPIS